MLVKPFMSLCCTSWKKQNETVGQMLNITRHYGGHPKATEGDERAPERHTQLDGDKWSVASSLSSL